MKKDISKKVLFIKTLFLSAIGLFVTPVYVALLFVLPISIYILFNIHNNNLQNTQMNFSSSRSTLKTPLASGAAYSSHKNYVGMGCYSLGQRISRYGY